MTDSTAYKFEGLLQNDGWVLPGYVSLDEDGHIERISDTAHGGVSYSEIKGYALPGMQNAHSHAFQYAMVGLTEQHKPNSQHDDFWAWRTAMYQLALSINPDQMQAIAAAVYLEMLKHGYTEVAEFHYVHHDVTGKAYNNQSELGERLIAAAKDVGIKITLIPIFYQLGGFGKPAHDHQKRFLSQSLNDYQKLLDASRQSCTLYENATIGHGIHSLRAVDPPIIKEYCQSHFVGLPFHIHVAERLKEVKECYQYLGQRPMEWLLDNVDMNREYHLVHSTHMTEAETTALGKSGAHVVLCPSTEGNLGDGLFPLKSFLLAGGKWNIGTDSQIGINPFEELRMLDYRQRIHSHRRDTFTNDFNFDSGLASLTHLIENGRSAMGKTSNSFFETGNSFDAVIMDAENPLLAVCHQDNLCSTIVYASNLDMYLGTIVNGKWVIKQNKHQQEKEIKQSFLQSLQSLNNR